MTVHLVGAGPGDPGLLTVRGAEVLRRADVVVHDRLSHSSLLDLAPAAAERISVGKTPRSPSTPQEEINRLLVEKGRAGLTVVRLKGGDPFVFGRGGEEAAALAAAGVPFEVVPGITSAVAVPAYAGVPVTHRGLSTSFTVVTGHDAPWASSETDWEAVARVGGTIVVLMGVASRGLIAERLQAGGLRGDTPVVATRWGTRPDQRTVRTTLAGLGAAEISSPAVLVIGAVAGLDLGWYEQRPLFGRRVVVTRARTQASDLAARLADLGAEVIEVPTIEIADAADRGAALADAAGRAGTYDWVVFTSANAVERFVAHLRDARAFGAARVAAVGAATAEALAAANVLADLVPDRFVAEALVDSFPDAPEGGGRVLVPQAADARPVLADGLRAKGWYVDVVEAYRTVPGRPSTHALAAAREADAITFTSSSTVTGYLEVAGADAVPPVVVSIGPITSATAKEHGLDVAIEADPSTVDGLVAALRTALQRTGDGTSTDL
ncbi:MAG: uroporphyrinogen-III synthase/uroporphyrinogen-III C-methyltransferase [Acidimicrobiales bacterium]|nr:uroporphyrinogen-III synthase/uroporphyrinogen-III C-methyltransferase [Acidimicrobiales bacterium]